MPPGKGNPAFMSGVPELLVLRLLADREMYGYELVQAIHEATGEAIKVGEGVVYPMLHALEQRGCLRGNRKSVNGRTRVYYITTSAGRKRLNVIIEEWRRITRAVSSVVKADSHAIA